MDGGRTVRDGGWEGERWNETRSHGRHANDSSPLIGCWLIGQLHHVRQLQQHARTRLSQTTPGTMRDRSTVLGNDGGRRKRLGWGGVATDESNAAASVKREQQRKRRAANCCSNEPGQPRMDDVAYSAGTRDSMWENRFRQERDPFRNAIEQYRPPCQRLVGTVIETMTVRRDW